eukprot:tig00000385_g24740.t1
MSGPSLATDGQGYHGKFYGLHDVFDVFNTYHSSLSDTAPWVQVDLKADSRIDEIDIYNADIDIDEDAHAAFDSEELEHEGIEDAGLFESNDEDALLAAIAAM